MGVIPKAKVILVCGPPGSGKTTFVQKHRRPGDLVWDLDAVIAAFTGIDGHERPKGALGLALVMREAFYRKAREQEFEGRLWIIESCPKAEERSKFKREFDAAIALMTASKLQCMERVQSRGPEWVGAVTRWFAEFTE